ncbi:MAG: rhombosortase [Candidatus Omnitrophica bacterium]|nr:rhombosortase [Candidatus Omnitrophota bacterium]
MSFVNKNINSNSHGTFKVPWLTLMVSCIVLVLFFIGPNNSEQFVFDKTEICNGSTWRLMTGHLIHNNLDHLFWDLLAFMVLGNIIESYSRKKLIVSFILSSFSVSLWMFVVERNFTVYYGLSGLLNGLLVIAVFDKWKQTRKVMFLYVLVITAIKMIYEIITNNVFFIDPSIPTIPGTHLAGFLMGCLIVFATSIRYSRRVCT